MKFSHVLVNLIAAVAQPQLELAHLVEEAGQPEQRADASFTVYVNGEIWLNYAGSSNTYSINSDGAKDNFPGTRCRIRLSGITNGFHLTLYSTVDKGGIKDPRLNEGNIGQCFHAGTSAWLSYGLFNDN
ncbi:hypothetical protein F4801DRAFT_574394 [Xylaria longipes]|nr:hypothetical protein F4801DRAFT_574394 [Xylaria longipes]